MKFEMQTTDVSFCKLSKVWKEIVRGQEFPPMGDIGTAESWPKIPLKQSNVWLSLVPKTK